MIEWLVSLAVLSGAFFTLVGSIGLLRFPDLLSRLHAPTKAATLGLGLILAGSMLYFVAAAPGADAGREPLIVVFLFLGAPVGAYMLARAARHLAGRSSDPDSTDR